MKNKKYFEIILAIIMEVSTPACKAQSYSSISLDWDLTWGLSYNYSPFHPIEISAFWNWTEFPIFYNRIGFGIFGKSASPVMDSVLTDVTINNNDTTLVYSLFERKDYPLGYIYYEPGIKLGGITFSCKLGMWFAYSSGVPDYVYRRTIITESGRSGYSSYSTSSARSGGFGVGIMIGPNVTFHSPWPADIIHFVFNVGYDFFLSPFTKGYYYKDEFMSNSKGWNGLNVGLGVEFPL